MDLDKGSLGTKHLVPASPTNFNLTYARVHGPPLADPGLRDRKLSTAEIEDRIELCRLLRHGAGFWDWMTKPGPNLEAGVRPLPRVNLVAGRDARFGDTIIDPIWENRLQTYLSNRPLGIGIIATVRVTVYIVDTLHTLTVT